MKLHIDRSGKTPLYLQIRSQIRQLILANDLPPGFRLPPERKLATTLGVNRSTVVNAYHELVADGLIQPHVGKGTIVSPPQPVGPSHDRFTNANDSEALGAPVQPISWQNFYTRQSERLHNPVLASILDEIGEEDQISFALGSPAGEYYPLQEFSQISQEVMRPGNWQAFEYGPTIGHYPLRQYIADWLSQRGIRTQAQTILITSGSQQGLDLLTKVFLEPGDYIVMEEPSFLGAIGVFKASGAHILTVPLDQEGLRIDVLEQILARHRPKFIYTLPTFQNPSGITTSLARRQQLLKLAYQYHVPIVEDDPYSELFYGNQPFPSLKSLDEYGHVIYLGTFSKILFPGLRLGWCVAPTPVLEQLSLAKQHVDLHTSTTAQWVMTEFCKRGLLDEHLLIVRKQYKCQRDAMVYALKEFAPQGLSWTVPEGGYYLWCELPPGMKAAALLTKAAEKKVTFVPGNAFYVNSGGKDRIRLCFCRHSETTIREGIYRLCEAITEMLNQSQTKGTTNRPRFTEPLV
ncbi:PLP-dependent aminotransferase family protein [Desulfosporosinus sp. BICA1-9]|uniref:MocR-like pyridoxine biosynthesis transcription factor PdxR n=1 Tax=Desulfosporosinus sp. BICA1-9 TaxID=1531958 RepID=UPI00054B74C0|nr:PLP-dependent aminotransferase family protein [Desulfosporosinus sp. BICA1-9]KJS48299.1 MAG: aminotransferase [Peptococcaceae bacterium BRH_c23]KJS84912.1 MAG: aminotransferase [Desulfosporosinus sp. BICA1-9]HBW38991.1 PLP-dependent aminotransferase family protein [Desulfosporosinus sp.]